MTYAELNITSNFTFLTGASHPEELVTRAHQLGLSAIALTDTNSFAGIVRAHAAAKSLGIRFIVGVRLLLQGGDILLAYPKNRTGYGHLCRLLTLGKRRTKKGQCDLTLADVLAWGDDCLVILMSEQADLKTIATLKDRFQEDLYLGLFPRYDGQDTAWFKNRASLAEQAAIPLVACGNIIMHHGSRRRLADILTCIRERCTVDTLGLRALPNAEQRLKSEFEINRLFQNYPEAVQQSSRIADACRFSLDDLRYEYPDEVTNGQPPDDRLRFLTEAGLKNRYPTGTPLRVRDLVEKELRIIAELDYARYFLTVYDIVAYARGVGILCQGRGSAANSAVCYALGITEASPDVISMVFERFVSAARDEPPDIDVDFEHERREEVIQHIYQKYGRHRAGLCATVVHFRSRAALREVGTAMGLSVDSITALTSQVWGYSSKDIEEDRARAAGLDPTDLRLKQTLDLTKDLIGFPRHLSQHVGGFVITRGRLDEFCPVENAAMADRTVIEWDKDDIDALGMLKVDILSLGMLSCLRGAFDLLRQWKGQHHTLASLPPDDPKVYDMLCKADTVGVFQVESRAQMSFLPRMRPRTFYDLVIEVAIIRPGPIQGDMVHPYLKRRRGEEPVSFPSKDLEPVLGKTLGVPLFQEQVLQIAVVAAGFTPSDADQLRRALGSFRGPGSVASFRDRFIKGCLAQGYDITFAENCFKQLEGFSGYGFPESHAASFALLVYVSSWIKCHHPDVFCCAILNAQPMGFYAPAQLVRDARMHGVTVRPICVEHSYWDCVLEPAGDGSLAVRLGFRLIKGLREEDGHWLAAARGNGYRSVEAIWRRAGLNRAALGKLAGADAFHLHGLNRREALWAVKGLGGEKPLPLFAATGEGLPDITGLLPLLSEPENVFEDYVSTRLTLRQHPVDLLADTIGPFDRANSLGSCQDGSRVTVSGLVITRQRPGTASGVIFLTLEDATASCNIVIWPDLFKKFRKIVMTGRLLKIHGTLQREGLVTHVIAKNLVDLSSLLDTLGDCSAHADTIDPGHDNADETKRADDRAHPSTRGIKAALSDIPLQPPQKLRVVSGARHPREQAKKLFPSRDFH